MMMVSFPSPLCFAKNLRINLRELSSIRALSTAVSKETEPPSKDGKVDQELFLETGEQEEERERYIEMRRNKSRLYPQDRNRVHNKPPWLDVEADLETLKTVRWNRRMYGRYGNSSNVDPRIAWPTKEDLVQAKEYESLLCPKSIQEMVEEEKAKIMEKERKEIEQDKKIIENLKKMNVWKEEMKAKITKKLQQATEAKEKRAKLIEDVRRHIGYAIDPRDNKFQEILEQKEKEERKALKEAKKQKKHEEMVAKMMKLAEDDKKERDEKKLSKTKDSDSEPQKE
ncbi:unnamed protein product [Bemisia tabaci]|uniref:Large ribosomal subunit protein mL64 n=1 Tax=Bemisia tabaci TaxID=7038 RepID=A0A9P0AEH2_BEMTA|nr:unnamed protein product [Bemisia tabaci]